jgi:DNA-binding beta-propeller fold protein YncE
MIGGNPWGIWISPDGIAYLGEGYNSGIYSYNANTLSVLNNSSNPLSPGGIAVSGLNEHIAVLSANWGENGIVYLRNSNWQPITQWTVALTPTDICYFESPSPVVMKIYPSQKKPYTQIPIKQRVS